jgi:hypothetical protein
MINSVIIDRFLKSQYVQVLYPEMIYSFVLLAIGREKLKKDEKQKKDTLHGN